MNGRLICVAVLATSALCGVATAYTPFAGTWVAEPEHTEFSLRPLELSLTHATYKRMSCWEPDEVAADGTMHPISGNSFSDAMSVRVIDAANVEVVQQANGKTTWQGHYTVADDARSMILKYTDERAAKSVSATIRFEREGDPVAGAHRLSGTWQAKKMLELSPSGSTLVFEDTEHGLAMHASDGRSFDNPYGGGNIGPLLGYLDGARVHIGRRDPHLLQINRTQNGKMVEFVLADFSEDGQHLAFGQTDWPCQSKMTVMYRRQTAS